MALIVTPKGHNPLRASRFWEQIQKIAKERNLKNIGVVYTSSNPRDKGDPNDDGAWVCHKCEGNHDRTKLKFEDGHKDILMDCPTCSYPFLIIRAL